jgi:CHASE3 domain sensor protein
MPSSSKAIAACGIIILLGIGMFSFRSTMREQQDRQWVTHTHQVLEKLQAVLIDITQCETGQRGYMLTGQEKYLAPYRAGLDQLHLDIKELRELTSDNPTQQDAIKQLESLITSRLTALARRIKVFEQSGLRAGIEAETSGNDGEERMDQIRALTSGMRSTEQRLLDRRIATATASSRRMKNRHCSRKRFGRPFSGLSRFCNSPGNQQA